MPGDWRGRVDIQAHNVSLPGPWAAQWTIAIRNTQKINRPVYGQAKQYMISGILQIEICRERQ